MNTELLGRTDIETVERGAQAEFERVAADAALELGYGVASATVSRFDVSERIRNVLRGLGIRPLTGVQEYMEAAHFRKNLEAMRISLVVAGCILLVSVALACLVHPAWLIASAIAIVVVFMGFDDAKWEWQFRSLATYTDKVPTFALDTALRIKRALEVHGLGCPLGIASLEHKVVHDPFLYIDTPDGQRYYLEVWDEDNFLAEREV
jgi:hypothetical protein